MATTNRTIKKADATNILRKYPSVSGVWMLNSSTFGILLMKPLEDNALDV